MDLELDLLVLVLLFELVRVRGFSLVMRETYEDLGEVGGLELGLGGKVMVILVLSFINYIYQFPQFLKRLFSHPVNLFFV